MPACHRRTCRHPRRGKEPPSRAVRSVVEGYRHGHALAQGVICLLDHDPKPVDKGSSERLGLYRLRRKFGSGRDKTDLPAVATVAAIGADPGAFAGVDAAEVRFINVGTNPDRPPERQRIHRHSCGQYRSRLPRPGQYHAVGRCGQLRIREAGACLREASTFGSERCVGGGYILATETFPGEVEVLQRGIETCGRGALFGDCLIENTLRSGTVRHQFLLPRQYAGGVLVHRPGFDYPGLCAAHFLRSAAGPKLAQLRLGSGDRSLGGLHVLPVGFRIELSQRATGTDGVSLLERHDRQGAGYPETECDFTDVHIAIEPEGIAVGGFADEAPDHDCSHDGGRNDNNDGQPLFHVASPAIAAILSRTTLWISVTSRGPIRFQPISRSAAALAARKTITCPMTVRTRIRSCADRPSPPRAPFNR